MYQGEDIGATAIDSATGGDGEDGMIRVKFKK